MRTPSILMLTVLGLAAAGHATAESARPRSAEAASDCTLCHGTEAHGNPAVGAPKLTGLAPWYVKRQLEAFRRGYRGAHPDDAAGMEMRAMAAALPDAGIGRVVADVAAYDDAAAPVTVAGDLQRGRSLYERCAACHGAAGEGDEARGVPALRGQNDWYLAKQLLNYRAGYRGAAAGDQWGAQMRPAALSLEDAAAVRDVVAYIASLSPGTVADGVAPSSDTSSETPTAAASGQTAAAPRASAGDRAPHGVIRHPLPNGSTFPIAAAVEVPAGTTLVYHSGTTPAPADPSAPPGSAAYWGDTETQARSALRRLQASLSQLGLDFGDVVKMTVFLAGDPAKDGRMDFAGFMAAYSDYFGTAAQPHKPARSAVQVAGLARPGMLVEIEVLLARP